MRTAFEDAIIEGIKNLMVQVNSAADEKKPAKLKAAEAKLEGYRMGLETLLQFSLVDDLWCIAEDEMIDEI